MSGGSGDILAEFHEGIVPYGNEYNPHEVPIRLCAKKPQYFAR